MWLQTNKLVSETVIDDVIMQLQRSSARCVCPTSFSPVMIMIDRSKKGRHIDRDVENGCCLRRDNASEAASRPQPGH